MESTTIIAVIILAVLVGAVYYSFFIIGKSDPSSPEKNEWGIKPQCEEGESIPCEIDGCNGMRICENKLWSSCKLNTICEPGSKEFCYENSCVNGYKICNVCGTGYGDCVLN